MNLFDIKPKACKDKAIYARLISRLVRHGDDVIHEGPQILKRIFFQDGKFECKCIKCNTVCVLSRVLLDDDSFQDGVGKRVMYNPPEPLTDIAEMIDKYLLGTVKLDKPKRFFYFGEQLELNCPNKCRPKCIWNNEALSGQLKLITCGFPVVAYGTRGIFKNKNTWEGFKSQRAWKTRFNDADIYFADSSSDPGCRIIKRANIPGIIC